MKLLQSMVIALSMYSKIPMPQVIWNKENMKYAMCFFPLVGVIIGVLNGLIGSAFLNGSGGNILFAVVMTLIPVAVTGGIHLDGLMDTIDALSSYGEREKKLAILKDSHAGAFALLGLCVYFMLSLGLWSEVTREMLPLIGCSYVLSRALSGLAVVTFPAAKDSGLARTFQDGANRQRTGVVMLLFTIAAVTGMLWLSFLSGLVMTVCALAVFVYYRVMAIRQFGGITGDLAGYFLQLCELAMLSGAVLAGGVLWR